MGQKRTLAVGRRLPILLQKRTSLVVRFVPVVSFGLQTLRVFSITSSARLAQRRRVPVDIVQERRSAPANAQMNAQPSDEAIASSDVHWYAACPYCPLAASRAVSPPMSPAARRRSSRATDRCCPSPRRRELSSSKSRRLWILGAGSKRCTSCAHRVQPEATAASITQCIYSSVSRTSFQKSGVFLDSAGDFWGFSAQKVRTSVSRDYWR
jgi:hypothetical protein